jgi:pyruvate formate lyase activating enzyme
MKVISISKSGDLASIALSGCPMKCGYCAHGRQDRRDYTVEKVISEVATDAVKRVYIGGMDPLIQKKELFPLVKTLKQRGMDVTVKTSGNDPNAIKDFLPYVDRFSLEIKCPLDDARCWSSLSGHDEEWVQGFLVNLKQSLETIKGRPLRIMTRVIPRYIDMDRVKRIGEQLAPYADEAILNQFLSNPMTDIPWNGIEVASPPVNEMLEMGEELVKSIPSVRVHCSGFQRDLRR